MLIKSPDIKDGRTATEVAAAVTTLITAGPVPGPLTRRTEFLGIPVACADLCNGIVNHTDSANPMRKALVSAVILAMFHEKPIPPGANCVTEALVKLIDKFDRNEIKIDDMERVLRSVYEKIHAGQWTELVSLVPIPDASSAPAVATVAPVAVVAVSTATAPVVHPEETKFSMKIDEPAKLEYPEVKIVTVPDVPVTPTNPMSSMASAILDLIRPSIHGVAEQYQMDTLNRLQPVIEKLHTAANRPIPIPTAPTGRAAPSASEEDVSRIVDARLSNGAGEIVRGAVATSVPTVISEVLEAAAKAIAEQGPRDDMTKAVLKANFVPLPDPKYAWDENLSTVAEIIESASAEEPQNALLVGPTGAGKTEYAIQFAARYSRPVMIIDCANVREAREWFGIKGASNGATYFRKAQFWLAVEAGGFVIVLDEFNRASDYVRNPLMPLLDHRRSSYIEEVGEVLRVGPGTVFFANGNEGLQYSGTHAFDLALRNRFPRRIEINYLPEEKEVTVLLDKVPGLGKRDAESLVSIANTIRQKAASFGGGLSETISTRQLIAAAKDFARVGPKSFMFTVFSHFSAEGGKDSERATVVNMFQLKGYSL